MADNKDLTEEITGDGMAGADETMAEEVYMEDAEADNEEVEADATETEAAEEAESSGEGKTGWAEKRAAKKQAKQKEEAYKEQIAQLEDKVMRQMAEFENFRKRTEKEKQAMFETGAKSIIEKILPVVDNFERGFATVDPADEEDAFVDGMRKVYKQLMTELEKLEVKPIEAVGCEFDPNLHNAVMQAESDEYESGIIAQELLKGYTYRDSVVRHSMVSVTI
ncbi:MAG: nucleotide exchange factor GrpE [Lachnospiraceae bacterium]|nr:nucleotide exchange factor GrpE [Lachnospiraceae bacterium]